MINIDKLCKSFKTEQVLKDFSLSIPDGSVCVLVGPSGCGKTTLLKLIAGLESPDSGRIECTAVARPGQSSGPTSVATPGMIPAPAPHPAAAPSATLARNKPLIRMVFQEDRLLPWASLSRNLLLALPPEQRRDKAVLARLQQLLEDSGLEQDQHKYPRQLSGGMRKRAALVRAFMPQSDIILLDEPLQAIDWKLKLALVEAFRRIWQQHPATVVFVTHDIQEAALLGDVIHVLDAQPMRIRQTIQNTLPVPQRLPYAPELQAIEQQLFRLLTRE